jgi:DNA-binding NtrC family response regulator
MNEEQTLPVGSVTVQSALQNKSESFMTLEEVERKHIERALFTFGSNKTKAAKALGISLKTLYNKLHAYGMMEKSADEK